jgi:hypothetical protein
MTARQQYQVRPEAVRSAVGNVGGILLQVYSTVMELQSLSLAPAAFARIGSPVAAANIAMQGQLVGTMRALLQLLQETNSLVHRSANDYEAADRAVSLALGAATDGGGLGVPAPRSDGAAPDSTASAGGTASGGGGAIGSVLAGYAIGDSAGRPGDPGSVSNVVGYLTRAGLGDLPEHGFAPTFRGPNQFADWLDDSPANQQRVGVLNVYSGYFGTDKDLSSVVHAGDVVVVEPYAPFGRDDTLIGIAAGDGRLYNHGQIGTGVEFGRVRVYRPMSAATPLW